MSTVTRDVQAGEPDLSSDWVPFTVAAKQFKLTRAVVFGMAQRGLVAVLDIPGSKPLVSLSGVQKLVRASVRPVRTNGSGGV